jgi:CubicO group peptidase (beta-lactamase class C family)
MSSNLEAPQTLSIGGYALGRFAPIADVFARIVASQGGGGAALSIYEDRRSVVDLYAGNYAPDTLQLVHSVTKVMSATAAAMAHDVGLVDLDAPLADCWPAFRRPSTASITLRDVLSHRSGLVAVRQPLSLDDLLSGGDEAAIERQEPYWEPRTTHGYHGYTFGSLLNGVFTRTIDTTVGQFVAERIAGPLGLELWIGVPTSVIPRVSTITYKAPAVTPLQASRLASGEAIVDGHFAELGVNRELFNTPAVLQASWPGVSGVAGARDLARLLAATTGPVDGVRLTSPAALSTLTTPRSRGLDRMLGVPSQFSTGLQLPFAQLPFLGPSSFGHEAAGGSMAFADMELGLAVGFTTNVHQELNGASSGALALLPTIRHLATADVTDI